ncbi:F-box only protein 4 [Anguilla anguilla]|uniref:F-box only protein 4 n=1 Tax=Anguilla anguilla TaxID=7936 RepID=UPI0015A9A880|nr:F-box only protein 4 [Anguilla anguilla]
MTLALDDWLASWRKPEMSETQWGSESAFRRSLRQFREKYFLLSRNAASAGTGGQDEDAAPGVLESLPADIQFHLMKLLSPRDLCRLGGTCRYWRSVVRDPLLWRYFFVRDMPLWSSIDHTSMPCVEALDVPLHEDPDHDFMAEYLRSSPACRRPCRPPRQGHGAVASFLQSLYLSAEPRLLMFGPGLEQLEVSLMNVLMRSPHVLPVAGIPRRQINGVGSGVSFMFRDQHKFNILVLYSNNSAERERARLERQNVHSRLFVQEGDGQTDSPAFSIAPFVQEVCRAVDGFIYVANAEAAMAGGLEVERAQFRAMLDPSWGQSSRPVLVLSCVSREAPGGTRTRTPCVVLAHQLDLQQLQNPWMVQDVVCESLAGVTDGIGWLLGACGLRL